MIGPRRRKPEPPRAPGWMVTYADLMSLMLTFFVMLVAFSEVRRGKLEDAVRSILGAMGDGSASGGHAVYLVRAVQPGVPG
ncbi:MAG: flagellar motor protein MotB, partial [FCB group bacterium]|nr:flagellar motor protein MotB [FCB group bacterium]